MTRQEALTMKTYLSDRALDALQEILAAGGVAAIHAFHAGELRAAGLVECLGEAPRPGCALVRVTDLD